MNLRRVLILIIALVAAASADAHRLDETLHAATLSLDDGLLSIELRVTPGVSVARKTLADIDANGDGTFSDDEKQRYVNRLLGELALRVDGRSQPLRTVAAAFPASAEILAGTGDIVFELQADLPAGSEAHTVELDQGAHDASDVYMANALMPKNPAIHIVGQSRNHDQSIYQVAFTPAADVAKARDRGERSGDVDPSGRLAIAEDFFVHGMRHILTGYDHLLFACALVLAVSTLWELVKVVTAFTIAHSITLTLATFDVVSLPSGILEPLIAASIVVVALTNVIKPGTPLGHARLGAAFVFGLLHGLAFAGGLLEVMHRMPNSMIVLAIAGFSVGVEVGHQLVLLPLFGVLRAVRRLPAQRGRNPAARARRIGSGAIAVAGLYYFGLALSGA